MALKHLHVLGQSRAAALLWRFQGRQAFSTAASINADHQEHIANDERTWEQDRISRGILQRHNAGDPSTSGRDGSYTRSVGIAATAPQVEPVSQHDLDTLAEYIQDSRKVVAVTGAGCSTESNIPDYRGPNGAYNTGFKPMTHQQFMGSAATRARYWARSFAGWHKFSRIQPNAAHESMTRLQQRGWVSEIVTQNVDRLHHKSGSKHILELHGTTHRVICMKCGEVTHRQKLQDKLLELNPGAGEAIARMIQAGKDREREDSDELDEIPIVRPDGDVELQDAGKGFLIPTCESCGGILKPNVVFFGDGIPKDRAQKALDICGSCETLLVVGSSMQVYSAFRLAKAAVKAGASVVVLTAGETRVDPEASFKVEALAGETLARLACHSSLLAPKPYS